MMDLPRLRVGELFFQHGDLRKVRPLERKEMCDIRVGCVCLAKKGFGPGGILYKR
jgi:hypothetical protein